MYLTLMFITNDSQIASIAQQAGVDRIFIDLEKLGKEERQSNRDSVKSDHHIDDIASVKSVLTSAELLVRINPINRESEHEINQVILSGADIIMLPMFKTTDEVAEFIRFVDGRAKINLLLETKEAYENIDNYLDIEGIDEIHIGLNDLHLAYKKDFMFELLTDGTVDDICKRLHNRNMFYGFGGIARIGYGDLPSENILAEHYRLKSQMAILSRSFCDVKKLTNLSVIRDRFNSGVEAIRRYERRLQNWTDEMFAANHIIVDGYIKNILAQRTSL